MNKGAGAYMALGVLSFVSALLIACGDEKGGKAGDVLRKPVYPFGNGGFRLSNKDVGKSAVIKKPLLDGSAFKEAEIEFGKEGEPATPPVSDVQTAVLTYSIDRDTAKSFTFNAKDYKSGHRIKQIRVAHKERKDDGKYTINFAIIVYTSKDSDEEKFDATDTVTKDF
jgi:hypothetical protein